MTLITLALAAIVLLGTPAGGARSSHADVTGPIGAVVATVTPPPARTVAPQDVIGPLGE
jgi:hypothetical protein